MEANPVFSTRWIVSKKYDLTFFIGSFIFTFIFWGIYQYASHMKWIWGGDSILVTYFLFTAFFDHPHIFQTFSRTHADPEEFQKRKYMHLYGLMILIAIGYVFLWYGKESELIVLASFFGSFHIIRQHYGFLRAYKGANKDVSSVDNWLDYGMFYSGMFACFFRDYTDIRGPVVVYKDLKAWFPYLPYEITETVWSIFWIFLLSFIVRQAWLLAHGKSINLPKILLLCSAMGTHYFVFFATATPFLVAEALETAYHDLQYHGWMMHFQKRKYPKKRYIALKWLGISLIYGCCVGVIEILGLIHNGWAMWVFVPFTMIVVYHYVVDGMIWKFGSDPELRKLIFSKDEQPS